MRHRDHLKALEAKRMTSFMCPSESLRQYGENEEVDDEGIDELLSRVNTDLLEQKEEQNDDFRSEE